MHCLSTVIKKCVGPAGLVGSSSTSENANVGCVTGFAFARPANRWGLAGPDGCGRTRNVGTRELLNWIVASVRVGSFSPSGPVLTFKVTKGAVTPGGGGLTMRGRKCVGQGGECALPVPSREPIGTPSSPTTCSGRGTPL